MDKLSKEKRSSIMAAVHSKNTRTEMLVRHFLWSQGIRYRVHPKYLPGTPDIVIPKYKLVIFVNGCLWHGHENCPRGRTPKTRKKYWLSKIETNKNRDRSIQRKLKAKGWKYLTIWECQLRTQRAAMTNLPKLLNQIKRYITQIA